jgi:SAM-dependent methyltransferase
MDEFFQANLLSWDDRAVLHSSGESKDYPIGKVIAGGSCLHELETQEIGDIRGKDVVHLQCHIGLDTLSLKHLGARNATGLDFSPKAIEAARRFAAEAGTEARFVEAPVYDAVEVLGETYDIVFVSWGAIIWLHDIFRWARVVSALLRPGGKVYLLDFHPQMRQYAVVDGKAVPSFQWRTNAFVPISFDEDVTYTGDARPLTHTRIYEWIHPLSDIVNGLIRAGLKIDFLNEHDIVAWKAFPDMREVDRGVYVLPEGHVSMPLSFSISATKR